LAQLFFKDLRKKLKTDLINNFQGYGWSNIEPDLGIEELVFFDISAQPVPQPSYSVTKLQVIFGYTKAGVNYQTLF
jgi:hypothetical protein